MLPVSGLPFHPYLTIIANILGARGRVVFKDRISPMMG